MQLFNRLVLKRLCFIAAILCSACFASAQDPYYTRIDKSNGLPSNAVYDIFQDSKGFIWLAHNEGLSRYDGFEFKTYTNAAQTSRSGSNITEDKYGRIWYENFDGYLYYVQNDSLRSLAQAPALGFIHYGILDNILVVAQKNGLDIYDLASLRMRRTIQTSSDSFGGGGATSQHYYIGYGHNKVLDISAKGIAHNILNIPMGMIVAGKDGAFVWPKDAGDEYCYQVASDSVHKAFRRTPIGYVQKINFSGSYYWFCTPQGVWAYDLSGNCINRLYKDKSISCAFKDREGNYWLGTTNEGILLVPDINIKMIGDIVPNRLLVHNDVLYAATRDNAVYSYDLQKNVLALRFRDTVRHEAIFFHYDSLAHNFFLAAQDFKIMDENFRIRERWKLAIKDLCRVDEKYYATATSGSCDLVFTGHGGNSSWDKIAENGSAPNPFTAAYIVKATRGRAVTFIPATNTIYCGTAKGLLYFRPDGQGEIRYNARPVYVSSLARYGQYVYVLTTQNDLYRVDRGNSIQPVVLSAAMQRPAQLRFSNGLLYMLAANGINVLDTLKDQFVTVNINPAIPGNEINDFADCNGKMCIATDKGLLITGRQASVSGSFTPELLINAISANGRAFAPRPDLHFKYNENDIQFSYAILSFRTGGRFPLYYKVNSGKWQPANKESRTLKFVALSPGDYTVSFRLGEPEQASLFPVHTFSFSIARPFWLQWWFFACGIFLVSGIVFSYYKAQTDRIRKKNALVLEKVELEKSLRNSMLTSIRSQMNPHFFYNALNTIQSFIFSDDKRNASTYLVKFSQLTRMILEMSEKDSVTLNEEIKALTFYLELEKMRFDDDFDFFIRIGSGVDTDMIRIPPMIVQPYVENAIKHGLMHKKGLKKLAVEFVMHGDSLRIVVEDNGIGRKKASELNRIRNDKHQSFSTRANNKRIEILNKGRANAIGVAYVDKEDTGAASSGTTVIITIPIVFEKNTSG